MIRLTMYSRPGCHLCDDMKTVVRRTIDRLPQGTFEIDEIDISTDPELEARYGVEIPVLLVDGRKVAKYRIREDELARIVTARSDAGSRVRPT